MLGIAGLIISAITLYVLYGYAKDTRTLAKNSSEQLTVAERPFVAWMPEWDDDVWMLLGYAHNQGSGPALDVEAKLHFGNGDSSDHSIGCLSAGQRFHFPIGERSSELAGAEFKYRSISGRTWYTLVTLSGGLTYRTEVFRGYSFEGDSGEQTLSREVK